MLKDYAITVFEIAVFIGIALNFLHPRQNKMARLAIGVVLISAVLLPLVDIFEQNGDVFAKIPSVDFDDNSEVNNDMVEGFFENAIEEYVAEAYGMDRADVQVRADGFDLSLMKAQRLYVTLSDRISTVDYRRLEEKLAKEFTNGGECRVELDIR